MPVANSVKVRTDDSTTKAQESRSSRADFNSAIGIEAERLRLEAEIELLEFNNQRIETERVSPINFACC